MQDDLMRLTDFLERISRRPTAQDLWSLRATLLARAQDLPGTELAQEVTREFYFYLSELESTLSARQYNELASKLDITAVGLLALQDILVEQEDLWKSLALGSLGEGMMVLASRQYVHAWEQELKSVHRRVAWTLYGALWQVSKQHQPALATDERQTLIEKILAPVRDDETPVESRMLLSLRLFQALVLLLVAPLCAQS
jgi:hypothetical protein